MSTAIESIPVTETIAPAAQADVASAVRNAAEAATAIYPMGGQTWLDYASPEKRPGIGLDLRGLNRVVDYPARDLTITVEAGLTIAELSATLASENQWLPIDTPSPEQATVGGVMAANQSGPRRYGQGTFRDYCIGVTAVEGRGTVFKGGGRVVKNVAGYDFCKLLTGSLGTLGVITQVTLKVKPRPEASSLVVCDAASFERAEELLGALVHSNTTPTAIELLTGPAWRDDPALVSLGDEAAARLVVGLEGTAPEVEWMETELQREWQSQGVGAISIVRGDDATAFWRRLIDFRATTAALSLKISVLPSQTTSYCQRLRKIDQCSVQAHAGNGVIIAHVPDISSNDAASLLIKELQPAAIAAGGHCIVEGGAVLADLTRQAIWGGVRDDYRWMTAVKRQFDPQNVLNPGRFPYPS